ncbi:eukaryotic translation initiation factor 2 subunit 2-like isoform X2 [Homarus americanus]|uniref:eukaryotic translation initiation factor 2 subunit 2-like isoform X2 n=1 Tax=Homarus americanus TaxID=6706 RepID=UPI001C44222D|nr:eukaryotic translation initiation factor 2 subunit 2-like isoform X2 [Homarus americanus]
MADEDLIFDPSLKKKKKKKTGFNLDAALADGSGTPPVESAPTPENGEVQEVKESTPEMDDMEMFGKKKSKKKKMKPFNLDELSEALPDSKDSGVVSGEDREPATAQPVEMDDFDLDMDFSKAKKKRSKKKKELVELIAKEENVLDSDDRELDLETDTSREPGLVNIEEESVVCEEIRESGDGWVGSERDYTYDELLERAFNQLREKNPEMATGEKKKFVMKPPQVVRIGSKKTAFANFAEICRLLHRMPKHVLQFLLAELGTSGSIDGSNQLIIKGRFQQKQIENVLRRYIKEYVTCHTCRSPDTILQKDARLYFLQCEQCNSRCSVAPIKSGFQAVANKQQRQAIRASKN